MRILKNIIQLLFLFFVISCKTEIKENEYSQTTHYCSDTDEIKNEILDFLETDFIPVHSINVEYKIVPEINKNEEVLFIVFEFDNYDIFNKNLYLYYLQTLINRLVTKPKCSDSIVFLTNTNNKINMIHHKLNSSEHKINEKFDEFIRFCVVNSYDIRIGDLDKLFSDQNDSFAEKDKVDQSNGFCGVVERYYHDSENKRYYKFIRYAETMIVMAHLSGKGDLKVEEYSVIFDFVFTSLNKETRDWDKTKEMLINDGIGG